MFFNKLKEEMQNWVYVKLAKLEDKFMQRVADAIKASSQTPEELIKKYKHTQWYDVSPLVTAILEDRFNLTIAIPFAIYKGNKTVYSNSGYVGDTLKDACEKELKKREALLTKKVKKENKLSSLSNPIADKNAVTLEQIETVLKTQKSSPKAIKAIKELIKIRYEE